MNRPLTADAPRTEVGLARRLAVFALLACALAVVGCRRGKTDEQPTVATAEAPRASEGAQEQDAGARTKPDAKGASPAAAKPPAESSDDPRVQCPPGAKQQKQVRAYDGAIIIRCVDGNGVSEGPTKTWWSTGNLMTEEHFVHGHPDGISRIWFEDGSLFMDMRYRNGKADGKVTQYHENGRIAAVGEFREGRLVGEARAFDYEGRPIPVLNPRELFLFLGPKYQIIEVGHPEAQPQAIWSDADRGLPSGD